MKNFAPVLVHKQYRPKIDHIYRIPARFHMAAKYYIVFANGFQSHSNSEAPCFSKEILFIFIRDAYEVDSDGFPKDKKLRMEAISSGYVPSIRPNAPYAQVLGLQRV